jgi:ABC-type antimicrobial peptide transport system permease subunit
LIELLRTPMIAGRTFTAADVKGKPIVVVINQSLAAAIWPGEAPSAVLGREIESLGRKLTVIGVMANGKYRILQEAQRNYGYASFAQACCWGNPILFVKSRTSAAGALRAMREELNHLDPNIALREAAPLQSDIDRFLVPQRLGSWLIGVFALIGLLLAMTGLYGVLAFGVAQRMREFGVRLALGAQSRDIIRLVVRHGLLLVILGVTLGLGAAFAVGRLMSTFLFGLSGTDPVTFTVVPILLLIVAVGASLIPARRGAAADPMTSLRAE